MVKVSAILFSMSMLVSAVKAQTKPATRPNVIIIMADDLDSRQLSCYGGQNMKTKYIDQLADEGLKFNHLYASHATCVPTRASLFTGLYPMRHGSFQNHKPVYKNMKSIGHYLGDLGYRVGLTGKDHSTKPKTAFPFDSVGGFQPSCVSSNDAYILDDVQRYITTPGTPFCLFIMSINPHKPWDLGDPTEFNADKLVLPPNMVDTKETRQQFCKYLAEIRRLDDQVGDIVKLLKKTGQDKNTILIFLGEQGPQFPGGKWTCWDYGQRSSMIVRWPGVTKSAETTDAIVQYEDITPTLIDIAGGAPIDTLDGRSFLPVLKGSATAARPYAFGMYNNIPEGPPYPSRNICDGRYKLILNLTPERTYAIKWYNNPGDLGVWKSWQEKASIDATAKTLVDRVTQRPAVEFYDTANDPYELHNIAGDPAQAEKIERYRGLLMEWMMQQKDDGASVDRVYNK
ncbi:sulfatase family protein [Dawidia cretensis]|nr:sulfatase [Dawidia cretensis]